MSTKLQELLELCWSSPVFGDSYPQQMHFAAFQQKMAAVYESFAARFGAALARGLPDVPEEERAQLVRQIAAKCTALCSAVAVEIDAVDDLVALTMACGIMYLADSRSDRGDEAMAEAILRAIQDHARQRVPPAPSAQVAARVALLREMPQHISQFSRPEDAGFLTWYPCLNFLYHGIRTRELSRLYQQHTEDIFGALYGQEFAAHTIANIQSFGNVAMTYAIYRKAAPALPALAEVMGDVALMGFLDGPLNAAQRAFDDYGDRAIDLGGTAWNDFHINIFNQAHRQIVAPYVALSGVASDADASRLIAQLESRRPEDAHQAVLFYVDLVRRKLDAISPETRRRFATFITISKRFIESGYVNMLGDTNLAEQAGKM